jgi:hypothetical protein
MWTTIITTFIIAVTTLTGVLVAQWRASVNEDRKRQHERLLRNRDYRRNVYVMFITLASSREVLDGLPEANERLRELGVALATMRITSSKRVMDAAYQVYDAASKYIDSARSANPMDHFYSAVADAPGMRLALDSFIEAARQEDDEG